MQSCYRHTEVETRGANASVKGNMSNVTGGNVAGW